MSAGTEADSAVIGPGATIGIIGGGQLGRMMAMAAARLGYRTHIYAPESSGPAFEVSTHWTQGAYDDADALGRFADQCAVVTYEFENLPAAPIAALAKQVPLRPNGRALAIAQDRLAEKDFVRDLGGAPAPYHGVDSLADLESALAAIGTPAILKTRRLGYDGKGQVVIRDAGEAVAAWDAIAGQAAVLEGFVTFTHEFSILLARTPNGMIKSWDAPKNVHVDGILDRSTVPAPDALGDTIAKARSLAAQIAEALDYVGVMACEFFASADGPVFNEMAPRVHNSGHWTIEGALTSQFENHIRAICGLPLGSTATLGNRVVMHNIIGERVDDWPEFLADPACHLHLYGKGKGRAGRKMGHATWVLADESEPAIPGAKSAKEGSA
ncbi:5-(carboxyamino)imidazole ribonucleotide synthase [Pseudonocardia sp. TMWB2A]|uniref:5-(carboxyamino)imidazole ribonucleotide synthase n=1 Tax=Pseudonocardia sp. TMWB2A TaxID=687430 RepID=UPI00307D77B1